MAQVRDGIAGWICAVLPLIAVNLLGYLGLLNTEEAFVAGAVALLGSPFVGGAVTGLLGGRPHPSHPAGAVGAMPGGAIAGSLYLMSLLGLILAATKLGAEPELLAAHPVKVALAALCLASILTAVALGAGSLVGRRASHEANQRMVAIPRAQHADRLPAGPARRPSAPPSGRLTAAGTAIRRSPPSSGEGLGERSGSRPSPYREDVRGTSADQR